MAGRASRNRNSKRDSNINSNSCGFCHKEDQDESTGQLHKTASGQLAAHYHCMLYSSKLVTPNRPDLNKFGGFDLEDIKKEMRRGWQLKCSKCKMTGATVGCDNKRCKKTYHYVCAKESEAEIIAEENNGIYKIYCCDHKINAEMSSDSDDNEEMNTENMRDNDDLITLDLTPDDPHDDDYSPQVSVKKQEKESGSKLKGSAVKQKTPEISVVAGVEDTEEISKADTSTVTPQKAVKNHVKETSGTKRKEKTKKSISESDESNGPNFVPRRLNMRKQGTPKKQVKLDFLDTSENRRQYMNSSDTEDEVIVHKESLGKDNDLQFPCAAMSDSSTWMNVVTSFVRQLDDSGTSGQRKAALFWNLCKKQNCINIVISKMKTSVESLIQRISTGTTSEEDYHQVFQVLLATGCLRNAVQEAKQDIQNKLQKLDEEKALLCKDDELLDSAFNTSI